MHERASAGWTRAAEHAANQHTAALWLSFFPFSHLRSGRHAHVATQNGQTALARTAGMDPTPNLVVYGREGVHWGVAGFACACACTRTLAGRVGVGENGVMNSHKSG